MCTREALLTVLSATLLAAVSLAPGGAAPTASGAAADAPLPRLGQPATPTEIAGWNIDVEPNGADLPAGSGTPAQGAAVYAARCASCHGANLEGRAVPGRGAFPALVGGEGSLASDHPKKTVGSYWPYATTLFDYIRRAMPFDHPQTLTSDQVYAVTAFILARNHIIPENATMNATTLPKVRMPNRNGFYPNETEGGLNTVPSR